MSRFFALLLPVLSLVVALSVSVALASGDWPMSGHDAAATGYAPAPQAIGPANVRRLHVVWYRPLGNTVKAIAAANRIYAIHVVNGESDVLALDARTGHVLHTWTADSLHLVQPEPGTGVVMNQPRDLAYSGGRLVIAAVQTVVAINPYNSHVYWRVPGGALQITIAGHTVYTGKSCLKSCGQRASQAIDLRTGKVLWSHQGNWGHLPALIDSHLFQTWGAAKGLTKIYDPLTGRLIATLPLNALWTGDTHHAFADYRTGVSNGSSHSLLESVAPDGRPAWMVDLGKASPVVPVLAGDTLYVTSDRFHPGVIAVNAENGALKWAVDANVSATTRVDLIGAGHLVYALSLRGCPLSVFNMATGKLLLSSNARGCVGGTASALLVAHNTLYVVHSHGIVAYRA